MIEKFGRFDNEPNVVGMEQWKEENIDIEEKKYKALTKLYFSIPLPGSNPEQIAEFTQLRDGYIESGLLTIDEIQSFDRIWSAVQERLETIIINGNFSKFEDNLNFLDELGIVSKESVVEWVGLIQRINERLDKDATEKELYEGFGFKLDKSDEEPETPSNVVPIRTTEGHKRER